MPYHVEKSGDGYYVVSTDTGKKHSNAPMSKANANAQLKVLYMAMKKSGEMKGGSKKK